MMGLLRAVVAGIVVGTVAAAVVIWSNSPVPEGVSQTEMDPGPGSTPGEPAVDGSNPENEGLSR